MPTLHPGSLTLPKKVNPGDLIAADDWNAVIEALKVVSDTLFPTLTRVAMLEDAVAVQKAEPLYAFLDPSRQSKAIKKLEELKLDPKKPLPVEEIKKVFEDEKLSPLEGVIALGNVGVNPTDSLIYVFDKDEQLKLKQEIVTHDIKSTEIFTAYDTSAMTFKPESGLKHGAPVFKRGGGIG